MIEATLICDECGRVIDAAKLARTVRREAARQGLYRIRNGKDVCRWCKPIKMTMSGKVAAHK